MLHHISTRQKILVMAAVMSGLFFGRVGPNNHINGTRQDRRGIRQLQ